MFEEFPRAIVMLEAFFFRAEFGRMRLKSSCGCPQRMLHVEHLVIENQLDGVGGHVRAIEAIVHDDLIERRVEASIL